MRPRNRFMYAGYGLAVTLSAALASAWWTPTVANPAASFDAVFGGKADSWKVASMKI